MQPTQYLQGTPPSYLRMHGVSDASLSTPGPRLMEGDIEDVKLACQRTRAFMTGNTSNYLTTDHRATTTWDRKFSYLIPDPNNPDCPFLDWTQAMAVWIAEVQAVMAAARQLHPQLQPNGMWLGPRGTWYPM